MIKTTDFDFLDGANGGKMDLTLEPFELPPVQPVARAFPTIDPVHALHPPAEAPSAPAAALAVGEKRQVDAAGKLDLCRLAAPEVLLGLRRAMADLASGREVELLADAPGIDLDLQAFHEVTGATVIAGDSPQAFRIRKK